MASRSTTSASAQRRCYEENHPGPHQDSDYKGYTHHASRDEPQYEIKSDTTEHIAMHKGTALHKAG
jgi:hypothetical protein